MVQPLKNWYITSPYGYRIHPITNEYKFHNGIDLRAAIGTPIYSIEDGIIEDVNYNSSGGNQIFVKHNNNYRTTFSHLDRTVKNKGDQVIKGELIAYSGNTGSSTAPHIHYTVKYNGQRIDPETLIYEDPNNIIQDPYNLIGNYNFNNGLKPNLKKYAIVGGSIIALIIVIILYKRKNA